MFCGECGAKNEKSSKFCEKCGKELEQPKEVVKKKVVKKEKKPLSKKNKIGIGVLVAVIVILVGIFGYGKMKYTPEEEALKYFEAVASSDLDVLYNYLDVKSSKFTSKKVFKELMKNQVDEDDDTPKIINYKVTDKTISADGLYANVKISYTVEGNNTSQTETITLIKGKGKKLLFFNDWQVQVKTVSTMENFDIKVLKGSTVSMAGIKLTKSELNNKKSTDKLDVYTIPVVFRAKYPVTVKLPLGFEVETSVYPSSYKKSETITVSEEDLSDKTKKEITNTITTNLKTIYESAIANKKFSDIKASFEYKGSDLKDLESQYDRFNTSLNSRTRKLTEIKFDDVEIRTIDITDEGYLEVYFKADYDYKTSYKIGNEEKTSSDDSYMYTTMTFDYQDGYKLTEVSSLNYYFY